MEYIVVNIGCLECGVSSNIVGIFDDEEIAKKVATNCDKKYHWREEGENSFEVFKMPELNVIHSAYSGIIKQTTKKIKKNEKN